MRPAPPQRDWPENLLFMALLVFSALNLVLGALACWATWQPISSSTWLPESAWNALAWVAKVGLGYLALALGILAVIPMLKSNPQHWFSRTLPARLLALGHLLLMMALGWCAISSLR